MGNPYYNSLGENFLYAGPVNPTVTPIDADRGTVFIYTPGSGSVGVYQKQDNGSTTNWTLISGGGGGGGNNLKVEYITLTQQQIDDGKVTLIQTPDDTSNICLDVKGGGAQMLGEDFTTSGSDVVFGTPLKEGGASPLVAGDKIRVIYSYSA